jgi:hypothetical protein
MKRTNPKYFALVLSLFAASAAMADVIPTLSNIAPVGQDFQWNYNVNVTVNQEVHTGDYFTIYDFGSVLSTTAPAGWTFSTSLVGVTPPKVSPADDAQLLNLTWTYTGAQTIPTNTLIGIFSAVTTTNQIGTDDFAADATLVSGPQAGSKVANVGSVAVPVPEVSAFAPVLGLCGIVVLTALARRRRAAA